jgi:hypothetical protein
MCCRMSGLYPGSFMTADMQIDSQKIDTSILEGCKGADRHKGGFRCFFPLGCGIQG